MSNIYDKLNTDMIGGDISTYDSKGIVHLIKKRYDEDLFKDPILDSEKFFSSTCFNLNRQFFKKLDYASQKELACELMNTIKMYYCDGFDFSPQLLWFLAAVIKVCFNYLKELDQEFRDVFCTFDTEEGIVESFCRLIVVSETEQYCACLCHDSREWHKAVMKFDGEAFKTLKNTEHNNRIEQIISYLWFFKEKRNYRQNRMAAYMSFTCANSSSSIYWSIRKTCKLL